MAAEVSRHIKSDGKPITRDFLGGCLGVESKELDLDLQVPSGWEKRLDLKSGKVYIQRSILPTNQTQPSFPPKPKTATLTLFPNSPSKLLNNYNIATYQSVCTLDKVKSALDREWRVSSPSSSSSKKRASPSNSGTSSMATEDSSSHVSSSRDCGSVKMVAGACPACLMYVLISQSNPRCPKCNCVVPIPDGMKKPRIDLNMSI